MLTQKSKTKQRELVEEAVIKLQLGGVIAYPTEHCFGLGCDPQNQIATQRLLDIKQRKADQGLILVASTLEHVERYANLTNSPMIDEIKQSWPGHTSWLLEVKAGIPKLLNGKYPTIALRVSKHPIVQQLCDAFGGAIVSSSANRHGQSVLKSAKEVQEQLGSELDYILDAPIGNEDKPSEIKDGSSGEVIR